MKYAAKIPTSRLIPSCSAIQPATEAISDGRVTATYRKAIVPTRPLVFPTALIALYALSAIKRPLFLSPAARLATRASFANALTALTIIVASSAATPTSSKLGNRSPRTSIFSRFPIPPKRKSFAPCGFWAIQRPRSKTPAPRSRMRARSVKPPR